MYHEPNMKLDQVYYQLHEIIYIHQSLVNSFRHKDFSFLFQVRIIEQQYVIIEPEVVCAAMKY